MSARWRLAFRDNRAATGMRARCRKTPHPSGQYREPRPAVLYAGRFTVYTGLLRHAASGSLPEVGSSWMTTWAMSRSPGHLDRAIEIDGHRTVFAASGDGKGPCPQPLSDDLRQTGVCRSWPMVIADVEAAIQTSARRPEEARPLARPDGW